MHSVKKIVKYIEQISQLEHLQNKLKDDMIEGVLLRKVSQNKNKKEMILDEFIAQYGGTDPAPAGDSSTPAPTIPTTPATNPNPTPSIDSSSQGASTTPTATPSTLAEMITNLSNITFTTLPNTESISTVENTIKVFTEELTKTSNKIVNTIKALKEAHATELENSNVSNTQAITAKESEISNKTEQLKTLTENYNKINSYLNTLASASATTVNSVMDTLKNNGP